MRGTYACAMIGIGAHRVGKRTEIRFGILTATKREKRKVVAREIRFDFNRIGRCRLGRPLESSRVESSRVKSSRIGRHRRVPPDTRYASLINVIIKNVAIRSRRISSAVTRNAHRARISRISEIWRHSPSSLRPPLSDSTERTGRFFDARHLFFATACDGNRRRTYARRIYRQGR